MGNTSRSTATVRTVPRARQSLDDAQLRRLTRALERREKAKTAAETAYRTEVLAVLAESSFAVVAEATGLSTNTLQRWKREAT